MIRMRLRGAVASSALTVVLVGLVYGWRPDVASAGWTVCSENPGSVDFDYNAQWTSSDSTYPFYHPGTGCANTSGYYGWAGISGDMVTPSHAPNIPTGGYHSAGWQNVGFQSSGTWVQQGWCRALSGNCATSGIHLYEEAAYNYPNLGYYYTFVDIGGLNYSSTVSLYIEYFPNSGATDCPGIQGSDGYTTGPCWKTHYNNAFEAQFNTADGFSNSGEAMVSGETAQNYISTGDPQVEMPTTIYGSSAPSTTGLRIKGANGYVSWNSSLSSGYTSEYDERNCPQTTNCPYSPAYTVSNFYNYYKVETYGACGSGGC